MGPTVFQAWAVYPEYYRKGRLVGVFADEEQAIEAAKGRGEWGSLGQVVEAWIIYQADGMVYLLERAEPIPINVDLWKDEKDRKAAALAKLTPEDRKLLGLDD